MQREAGRTIDSPRGTRAITTLKKLPHRAPHTAAAATAAGVDRKSVRASTFRSGPGVGSMLRFEGRVGEPFPQTPGGPRAAAARRAVLAAALVGACAAAGCRKKHEVQPPPEVVVDTGLESHHFAGGAAEAAGGAHLAARSASPRAWTRPTDGVTTDGDVWVDDEGNCGSPRSERQGRRPRDRLARARAGDRATLWTDDPPPRRGARADRACSRRAWGGRTQPGISCAASPPSTTSGPPPAPAARSTSTRCPGPPTRGTPAATLEAGNRAARGGRPWSRRRSRGRVMIDDQTGIPLLAEIHGQYTMRRGEGAGVPMPAPSTPGRRSRRSASSPDIVAARGGRSDVAPANGPRASGPCWGGCRARRPHREARMSSAELRR